MLLMPNADRMDLTAITFLALNSDSTTYGIRNTLLLTNDQNRKEAKKIMKTIAKENIKFLVGHGLLVATLCLTSRSAAFRAVSPKSKELTHRFAFDFSSPLGWDKYYQIEGNDQTEWHASIPLADVVDHYVPKQSSCLVIGCGNSQVPKLLHDNTNASVVTCLDTSQTCLDHLLERYGDHCERLKYVCGDATELQEVLLREAEQHTDVPSEYQVILDKGLIDAILCGEGWNTPLTRVFEGAARVLSNGGIYLLISYRLPTSTKEFLSNVGADVGLEWTFDLPSFSNGRVSVSTAIRTRNKQQ